jgi:hypothetical protein
VEEAKRFRELYSVPFPMLVDSPEAGDPFMAAFAPWPTRFFVVDGEGVVRFVSAPNPNHLYSAEELIAQLQPIVCPPKLDGDNVISAAGATGVSGATCA